jgi:hypothetical protein
MTKGLLAPDYARHELTILFSVAGLRSTSPAPPGRIASAVHPTSALFPFSVGAPGRLLLLVVVTAVFLATWRRLYRS